MMSSRSSTCILPGRSIATILRRRLLPLLLHRPALLLFLPSLFLLLCLARPLHCDVSLRLHSSSHAHRLLLFLLYLQDLLYCFYLRLRSTLGLRLVIFILVHGLVSTLILQAIAETRDRRLLGGPPAYVDCASELGASSNEADDAAEQSDHKKLITPPDCSSSIAAKPASSAPIDMVEHLYTDPAGGSGLPADSKPILEAAAAVAQSAPSVELAAVSSSMDGSLREETRGDLLRPPKIGDGPPTVVDTGSAVGASREIQLIVSTTSTLDRLSNEEANEIFSRFQARTWAKIRDSTHATTATRPSSSPIIRVR